MYSKVKLGGHPVHTMLVGFPITLYAVAFACFVAVTLGADTFWFRVGVYANVAGVVTAAIAAAPGFVDWAFGVPTGSPAKATGMQHMLFHAGALCFFGLNAVLEWSHRLDADPAPGSALVLCGIGAALTAVGGYLGGKLVLTHKVGVALSPEQQRLEPRANARVERHPPGLEPSSVRGPRPTI
jgi:uncharacterized membrane protein